MKPVPPEVPARALMRFNVVMVDEEMVVVARVDVPEIARVPVAVRLPEKKPLPATVSLLLGVVEPMPTLPPSMTLKTSVPPSNNSRISPVPF